MALHQDEHCGTRPTGYSSSDLHTGGKQPLTAILLSAKVRCEKLCKRSEPRGMDGTSRSSASWFVFAENKQEISIGGLEREE